MGGLEAVTQFDASHRANPPTPTLDLNLNSLLIVIVVVMVVVVMMVVTMFYYHHLRLRRIR